MNVRQFAIKEIKEDLKSRNKSFLAFRKDLNPIMRKLVTEQLKEQKAISCKPSKSKCLFSKSIVKYKVGTTLVPKSYYQGFEKITICEIDEKYYHCKIPNGIVTIPIQTVNSYYEKVKV